MMNNKNTKKEPMVPKRRFYVALYSCLGVLLVLAAVFSVNGLLDASRVKNNATAVNPSELQSANASTVKSYLTPEDRDNTVKVTNPSETLPSPRPKTDEQSAAPSPTPTPQPTQAESAPAPAPTQAPAETSQSTEESTSLSPPVFDEFAEGDTLNWPVLGEVVMDYSSDHVLFDKTLEQYRTNENLCISSELGSPVHAAFDGVVSSIDTTRERGISVVLDHGNGWSTTYSQLQDSVLVKPGDVVSAGQVIGGVGTPSIYSVLLGSHLEFAVLQNSEYVDPKLILE